MVSIAASKMVMTELVFVVPGMEVNGQYYCDVLLSQPDAASDQACCKRYDCLSTGQNAPSHRARIPLNSYSKKRRT